jgi:hypothetical protein
VKIREGQNNKRKIKIMKNPNIIFGAILSVLACFAFLPQIHAVSPPPDGGYPGANTAEGQNALLSLTTGSYNTAVGILSLRSVTTSSFNTALGAGALLANTGTENTATGAGALLSNTTGPRNTADGTFALVDNVTGQDNTAIGDRALQNNTTDGNTAIGSGTLFANTSGGLNTAVGAATMPLNNTGSSNTAIGLNALFSNVSGDNNTAIGRGALGGSTGSNNIALGFGAGSGVTTASNAICIGTAGNDVTDSCYIGNIFGATSSNGVGVFVNSNGRLGTLTSSARFKDEIKPMDNASEALFALKPVAFRYKKDIDPAGTPQLGLVAEDVEKVNPDLVVRDKQGKPYSVRYEQVNAMLLNEFLKEHQTVQELKAMVSEQNKQINVLTAGLQKVSAQMDLNKPAPRTVANK